MVPHNYDFNFLYSAWESIFDVWGLAVKGLEVLGLAVWGLLYEFVLDVVFKFYFAE